MKTLKNVHHKLYKSYKNILLYVYINNKYTYQSTMYVYLFFRYKNYIKLILIEFSKSAFTWCFTFCYFLYDNIIISEREKEKGQFKK